MAHIYDVRFHTKVNNIFRIYRINLKANNQKDAICKASELWNDRCANKSKAPHQFHLAAKRTADSELEDGFHCLDYAVYVPYKTNIDWNLEEPCYSKPDKK